MGAKNVKHGSVAILMIVFFVLLGACTEKEPEKDFSESIKESMEKKRVYFSSENCSLGKKGKMYVALHHWVFEIDEVESFSEGYFTPEEFANLPPSPDPSQPKGCYQNPIKANRFSIDYQYEYIRSDSSMPVSVGLYRSGMVAVNSGNSGLINVNESSFMHHKENATGGCIDVAEFIECAVQPKDPTDQDFDNRAAWIRSYKAKEEVYTTPLNRPFIAYCTGFIGPETLRCQVTYKLLTSSNGDINLYYEFYLAKLPVEELVEFDKRLREKMLGQLIKNYPWSK